MIASAWAFIPIIISLVLWVPDLQILGIGAFSAFASSVTPFEGLIILFSAIVEIVLSVWYVVILIKSVTEAHQFSASPQRRDPICLFDVGEETLENGRL
jgi:hypothetical protein